MTSPTARREIGNPTSRPVSFYLRCRTYSAAAPVVLLFTLLCTLLWLTEAFGGPSLSDALALQAGRMRNGAFWQPLSYALVHGPWWHVAINLFVLSVTGCTVERAIGSLRMAALILLAIPAGAVGFLLSCLLDPRLALGTACVGASALSTACFGTISLLAPREKVTLWLLFIPIPFRSGWLLPLVGLLLCSEAICAPGLTAYGAHLGGWLLGLGFALAVRETN